MKSPAISVCIPVYNVEEYLPQCLDSIINQTFNDFEVIIVNDASPDNSEAIIQSYQKQDPRIRYYKHEKNLNLSATRKTAIDYARGEYLSFIDSDDWVEPTFLEKLYTKATSTQADVSVCNYFTETSTGEFKNTLSFNLDSSTTLLKWHLKTHGLAPSYCNKLWKRSLFSEPDISFPNVFFAEDMVVTTKLLFYAQKISIINEPLYYYRAQKSPSTDKSILKVKAVQKLKDEFLLHEELVDFFAKRNLKREIAEFLRLRKPILVYYLAQAFLLKDQQIKALIIQLVSKFYGAGNPYSFNLVRFYTDAMIYFLLERIFPRPVKSFLKWVFTNILLVEARLIIRTKLF